MPVEIKNRQGETIYVYDGADLNGANLNGAYLRGADLNGADLRDADLRDADLTGAYLRGADLNGANLNGAYLRGADLNGAYLRGADLTNAYLRDADLRDADLRDADLRVANLRGAILDDIVAARLTIVPDGDLIVYKKLYSDRIATLRVPADARRSNGTERKCRAEYADVIEITALSTGEEEEIGYSSFVPDFVYRVGQRVACDIWNEDRWTTCGGGIHFFLTREEAIDYEV